MESRRRSSGSAAAAAGSGSGSSSGIDDSYPGRSTPLNSCDYSDGGAGVDGCGGMGADGSGKELRACRSVSKTDSDASERSSKVIHAQRGWLGGYFADKWLRNVLFGNGSRIYYAVQVF